MRHMKWNSSNCEENGSRSNVSPHRYTLSLIDTYGFADIPKGQPSISDFALVRRQFHIFERALKKFKSDVGLWIQYVEIAKREGARALVGRITARYTPDGPLFTKINICPSCLHLQGPPTSSEHPSTIHPSSLP